MTCIVGIVDKELKKVILGGDSSGISGWDLSRRKDSAGCGSSYALASLYSTQDLGLSFSDRIIKSLECASYFSCGVHEPFNLVTT